MAAQHRGTDLVDRFGRTVTDLRVSLTDRCNLRCTYCMPAEGLDWLPSAELLTGEEITRVVSAAVASGVTEVRFTGGEPLLRRDLVDIVAAVARLRPRPSLSLTTNGLGLTRLAGPLADAGLDRVNVSVDTLDRAKFAEITRRDRLEEVLEGLAAARDAGLAPVKVNAVLMRGVNDAELPDLLRWCLREGYQLRVIEQMPLDPQHGWDRERMVTAAQALALLQQHFELEPEPEAVRGSAPAETWIVNGGPGKVGVIGSVTRPFCGACDRLRLTADGQLRNCLFARDETDVRTVLRSGLSGPALDAALAERLRANVHAKRAGHGIGEPGFVQPDRPMSAIGG